MSRLKLYYAPGACSLANHIALHEAGAPFDTERVDIRTHTTEHGIDFRTISSKGYVPALILADGHMLTENIAVLDYLATLYPQLAPAGPLGRTRMIEGLAFISTELHRAFKPMWHGGSERERAHASETVTGLLDLLSEGMRASSCSERRQPPPTSICSSCCSGPSASTWQSPSQWPSCAGGCVSGPPLRPQWQLRVSPT